MMSSDSDEGLPAFDLGGCSSKTKTTAQRSGRELLSRSIDEMSEKELRVEIKRREAVDKRRLAEMKKLEKQRENVEKKLQKEIEKAKKQATSASRKDDQPAERLKHMVAILDTAIAENSTLMSSLAAKLSEVEVEYRIGKDVLHPGTISWLRKTAERTVDEQAQILTKVCEEEQAELLVNIEAQGLAGLVHYTKMAQCGQTLPDGAKTFKQYVEELIKSFPNKKVTLVVQGVEAFLRGNKTHQNRQYRQAVTGREAATKNSSQRMFSDVTRLDCEEVLVDMQLVLGPVVRMCEGPEELAEYVVTMTKAISESYFKQSNPFSFHTETGQGPSKQALSDADSKVSLIFKHQLMQLNNVSEHMAAAVVSVYPSPAHLLNAYESCSDTKSAQLLLHDIEVRRGVGVVSSTRRLGPTHSKRIHLLMTATDQTLTLS
ncbi:crossover junction endonuclease EME1-like isoform X2 [Halichondria panicea]|uniref:crossover junction endonuclease EME1-like isoform X2 n=1 Tax=Halichondria panicea TaxID=6063 RepID=UPI00312B7EE3